jgi:hypothetical protein
MPIFEDRSGVKAVCGLVLLALLFALSAVTGRHQARAEEGSLFDFSSFLAGKPALKAPQLGDVVPWSGNMRKARDAYGRGDFETARRYLEPAADNGDITASFYLGEMYRLGRGVQASTLKALQYYQNVVDALTQDESDRDRLRMIIDAVVKVADIYRKGDAKENLKANPEVAFRLYTIAASYGHPSAHYSQGLMWLDGEGVKASPSKAVRWLFHAAKRRHPLAQARLGELYWSGDEVKRDRARAFMWYMLATQSARPEEHPAIFDRYDWMAGKVTAEQRAEAEKRALSWAEKFPVPPPPHAAWPQTSH